VVSGVAGLTGLTGLTEIVWFAGIVRFAEIVRFAGPAEFFNSTGVGGFPTSRGWFEDSLVPCVQVCDI
jgi:hypothetical protein